MECTQRQMWGSKVPQDDAGAVARLLATHFPVLRSRADARMDWALKARLEPEDILQEVYVDVFRQVDRFEDRGPDSFLNWVLTILDSKLVDAHRALHRQKRDVARELPARVRGGTGSCWSLVDQLYADSGTPSRVVRKEEAVGALMACMSQLSDLHRQVLRLRILEGSSVADVGDRLGKSPAVIVALTRRALEALRECMDRLGDFTHGA